MSIDSTTVSSFPLCISDASLTSSSQNINNNTNTSKPKHLIYNELMNQAQDILSYIITKFHEIDAPIILMYGTMLYEYRNSTPGDACLHINGNDKDFDIAVFPKHWEYIADYLSVEIQSKFGWKWWTDARARPRLFGTIYYPGQGIPKNKIHMIDVYGFQCNSTSDVIKFPWDVVTIARDSFLPVQRHKTIPLPRGEENNSNNTHTTSEIANDTPAYYMPYNPHCLLTNIYGYDYMTPKSGPTSQAKYGGEHGRPAYGNPQCNSTLSMLEQDELERQLKFCDSSEGGGIPEGTLDISS